MVKILLKYMIYTDWNYCCSW